MWCINKETFIIVVIKNDLLNVIFNLVTLHLRVDERPIEKAESTRVHVDRALNIKWCPNVMSDLKKNVRLCPLLK